MIARKVGDEKGASETSAATFVQDHAAMKMTKEMELMSHVISTLIRGAVGGPSTVVWEWNCGKHKVTSL